MMSCNPPHTKDDCLIATYAPKHTVSSIRMSMVHFFCAQEAEEFVWHLDELPWRTYKDPMHTVEHGMLGKRLQDLEDEL
jgi:hypothetical protein